ncbi:telomeric repeat-binding factor 2-interacting protein 1-like [Pimephales promelas]|uniref:telomeric repeat-binding factor 2-interacting protein 1-like n=1 Tax=Pimephales promelas TaxID=90988 RepID=UPI001955692E|nr:telomeric repeat-binding factor 2-interacting protein 1-like [Pimephales promelas]XP_039513277.1 telomeric repeat-binding factor 2-interacting protein 1-like [Pimephales promelas]XP_039513278.1 telomeric repeat-binding factor 2-interacting protein 1-like [Pimephales promelas]KAG1933679.1 telomeric repeat-binding factor 2-interacting protein [Pimephales promelas]
MSKPGEEKVSEISPVLFLEASGHSMRFYVRPGPTKTQLYPLISNGGGILCRNQEPGAILLVDPGDVTSAMASTGQKYISSKFIRDCVEQNQQLDRDDYVISVGPSVQTRMAARHQGTGRLGYSLEDDAAIVKFMEKRLHEAKGNLVWKEMEKRSVTGHSWQSMKDRFLKHLQHKLTEKSPKKSPSKRKALLFTQSPLSKKTATQTSEPEADTDTSRKSDAVSDSSETQISTECPTVRTIPPPSPERASSPPEAASESLHERQDESRVPVQEQETPGPPPSPERASSPPEAASESTHDRQDESRVPVQEQETSGPPPSPERASSPPEAASESTHDRQDESRVPVQEQETPGPPPSPERASSPPEAASESPHERQDESRVPVQEQEIPGPEISKSPRLEEDRDGQDIPDGSSEQPSLNKTKQTTSKTATADSKKLGILAKAAREFEDSDVMDESEEGEDPCEAPIVEPSDAHESSATPSMFAREPESQAEHHEEARQESAAPEEEERPGPSSTAFTTHAIMLNSESREPNHSQAGGTPEETLTRLKEQVKSLMRDSKKELVEVTKALLKASGDLARARVYLIDGYDQEIHGPLWNHLDDEVLLLADSYELEQLQLKFGVEEVSRRRAFLTAGKN